MLAVTTVQWLELLFLNTLSTYFASALVGSSPSHRHCGTAAVGSGWTSPTCLYPSRPRPVGVVSVSVHDGEVLEQLATNGPGPDKEQPRLLQLVGAPVPRGVSLSRRWCVGKSAVLDPCLFAAGQHLVAVIQ